MATSTTTSKPAKRTTRAKGASKAQPQGRGKASKPNASRRPTYDERTKAISDKARKLACPQSLQGPVAKQCADVMRDLKDPREAIASVGLSHAGVRKLANGEGSKEDAAKLRKLAERVTGAPQWTRGRPLAATLTAWLEQK